jgi:hypothetical protein
MPLGSDSEVWFIDGGLSGPVKRDKRDVGSGSKKTNFGVLNLFIHLVDLVSCEGNLMVLLFDA